MKIPHNRPLANTSIHKAESRSVEHQGVVLGDPISQCDHKTLPYGPYCAYSGPPIYSVTYSWCNYIPPMLVLLFTTISPLTRQYT